MNTKQIIWSTVAAVTLVVILLVGVPYYKVFSAQMAGKAALEEATQNRKIIIEEAQARLEAARLDAQSELIRAEGMAKAIEVEDGKLTDRYIQYLWVRNMQENEGSTTRIYIPTEANLPILEAGHIPGTKTSDNN